MAGIMEFPQAFNSVIFTVVIMIAGAANFGGVAAQTSGCTISLATLSPCMGYITSNVTSSPPPQNCCTALSSVVQRNSVCLCQLLTTNSPIGFPINQTQALALPGACKTTTPAFTRCKVAGVPPPSPVTGSSNGALPATETAPSSSPATPNAVSPSSNSPSLLPPTTSVGGISPTDSERPTSKAGALITPSMIISALAVTTVASIMW